MPAFFRVRFFRSERKREEMKMKRQSARIAWIGQWCMWTGQQC